MVSEYSYRDTFQSPYTQWNKRNGQTFDVLRVISKTDENHDQESLPMFEIRFSDGLIIEAWPEEVLSPLNEWNPGPSDLQEFQSNG